MRIRTIATTAALGVVLAGMGTGAASADSLIGVDAEAEVAGIQLIDLSIQVPPEEPPPAEAPPGGPPPGGPEVPEVPEGPAPPQSAETGVIQTPAAPATPVRRAPSFAG